MPSFPFAFRYCPFCAQPLGPPHGIDVAQVCAGCGATLYHSSKPGVGVVLLDQTAGSVLLLRRRWPPYRGHWGLPGGFVAYGEAPEAAAAREVREETGLHIQVERLLCTRIESYPRPQGRDRLLVLYYLARIIGGRQRAGDDALAVAWFAWQDLPGGLAGRHLPLVLQAAREAKSGKRRA